jgi:arylsulfatase A-like enzyme
VQPTEPVETRAAELTVLPPRRPPCSPLQGIEGEEDGTWDGFEGGVPDPARTRSEALVLYRGEAARLSAHLRALLAALPGPRPPIVALAGLHGLSIAEGGGTDLDARAFFWSDRLVDRTLHVPLAIAGVPGRRVLDQPVELLDLLPTLLARAGAVPPHGLPGQDLLAAGLVEDPLAVAYAERGDMLALRRGDHLLAMRAVVHHMSSLDPFLTEILLCPGLTGGFRLHDVRADPLQELDLRRANPALAEALEAAMIERRTGPAAPAPRLAEGDRLLRLRLTPAEGYW